jgi:opacity protein-like surface antigen
MRKPITLVICFTIMLAAESAWGVNPSGKLALSAKGGLCYSMGNGLGSGEKVHGRYGVGLSAEYFVLEPVSLGLTLVYNSFEGEWEKSGYYAGWGTWYYTRWTWTNVSLFAKFVMAPREEVSPYFTAGMGMYTPRRTDKWYDHPDTIHSSSSRDADRFGIHVGFGVHYFLSQRALVFLEIPLNLISSGGYSPLDGVRYNTIHDQSQIVNVFVGLSFLLGSERRAKETPARW